jgi:hypothetical protein
MPFDFKKLVTAPANAVGSLLGVGPDGPTDQQAMIGKLLANGGNADQFNPPTPTSEFTLPGLNDALSEAGQKRKTAAEAAGQPFVPGENDYADSGPYGYMHKKSIHDALMELHKEMQDNAPHIDYQGIARRAPHEPAHTVRDGDGRPGARAGTYQDTQCSRIRG